MRNKQRAVEMEPSMEPANDEDGDVGLVSLQG
jgi:hypothetical protein